MANEVIGLLMLAGLLGGILIGFPIAFTMIFLGIAFGYWGFGKLVFYLLTLQFNATMMESSLTAIPLFVFMGVLLERANLMERLFAAIQQLLANVRGALYLAVMLVATVFSAATGIVGASVTLLGIMAGRQMISAGYDTRLSAGLITAGGTLGILLPPSVMLIVMGPIIEVPVTTLFVAAILPGLLLAFLFTGYALLRARLDPSLAPLPARGEHVDTRALWIELFKGLVPLTVLIAASLGSIISGVATPTEGAACGALGACLLVVAYRQLSVGVFRDALIKTLEISVLILFLVAASNFFGAVFARLGTPRMLSEALLALELNRYVILIAVMALIFLLGWPLEWVPIVLIVVPFLLPLVTALGFDVTWFGILVAVNLQTAWLSPPVALSAYFLKGVVPQWGLGDIYVGMLQFMGLQLLGLAIIIVFPEIVLWLPRVVYGG